jgi:hypothetical protein
MKQGASLAHTLHIGAACHLKHETRVCRFEANRTRRSHTLYEGSQPPLHQHNVNPCRHSEAPRCSDPCTIAPVPQLAACAHPCKYYLLAKIDTATVRTTSNCSNVACARPLTTESKSEVYALHEHAPYIHVFTIRVTRSQQ